MSKITIKTSETGAGRGTKVLIDGEEVRDITRLTLEIPADDFATLTIEKLSRNEQGRIYLIGEDEQIATEEMVFKGLVEMDGDRIPVFQPSESDRL